MTGPRRTVSASFRADGGNDEELARIYEEAKNWALTMLKLRKSHGRLEASDEEIEVWAHHIAIYVKRACTNVVLILNERARRKPSRPSNPGSHKP